MLKLAHVLPWFFVNGGSERCVYDMCKHTKDVFDNYLVTPGIKSLYQIPLYAHVTIAPKDKADSAKEYLNQLRPDIIVHHGMYNHKHFDYGKYTECPIISVVHGDVLNKWDLCNWGKPEVLFTLFDGIEYRQSWNNVNKVTMNLGVDLNIYKPKIHSHINHLKCCVVSRITTSKLPIDFIHYIEDDPWYSIDVLGESYYLPGMALKKKLDGKVRILNPINPNDMPDFYPGYDVALLPSIVEAGSYYACEAMASGLPIVSLKLRSLEWVMQGKSLFANDYADFFECVRKLRDENLRNKIGQDLRKVAEKFHDIKDQVGLFVSTIEDILGLSCVA